MKYAEHLHKGGEAAMSEFGRCLWVVSSESALRVRTCGKDAVVKLNHTAFCLEHFQAALRRAREQLDSALRTLGA